MWSTRDPAARTHRLTLSFFISRTHIQTQVHTSMYVYIHIHTRDVRVEAAHIYLQHTATHCNTPQHTATHCNILQHTTYSHTRRTREEAAHVHTLQHPETRYNTMQHTETHCNKLQHTATHCNTLQQLKKHAASHYIKTHKTYKWRSSENIIISVMMTRSYCSRRWWLFCRGGVLLLHKTALDWENLADEGGNNYYDFYDLLSFHNGRRGITVSHLFL